MKTAARSRAAVLAIVVLASCAPPSRTPLDPRIEELIRNLQSEDPGRQRIAQDALIAHGAEAVRPLLASFEQGHVGERIFGRATILKMMEATPPPPQPYTLTDAHLPPYPLEADTLVKIGEAAVPALLDACARTEEPQRSAVLDVLSKIGGPAVLGLVELLRSSNPPFQRNLIEALLRIAPSSGPFRDGFRDLAEHSPDAAVRRAAAQALERK